MIACPEDVRHTIWKYEKVKDAFVTIVSWISHKKSSTSYEHWYLEKRMKLDGCMYFYSANVRYQNNAPLPIEITIRQL